VPAPSTLATAGTVEFHVMAPPLTAWPRASLATTFAASDASHKAAASDPAGPARDGNAAVPRVTKFSAPIQADFWNPEAGFRACAQWPTQCNVRPG